MTVIEEVLAAEKLSEEKILKAKEEAVAAVLEAKKDQNSTIDAKKADLAEKEAEEIQSHKKHLETVIGNIAKDTNSQVSVIENKFDAKKAEVSEMIKRSL